MDWSKLRAELLGDVGKITLPPQFEIPVLPTAIIKFTEESDKEDANVNDLARILETDAGLTADLLHLVNSSTFGLRRQATSVKQAMNLLSISRTRNFLLTTGVKRAMSKTKSKLINLNNFWAANLEKALFAREIALLMGVDSEVAYSAGMLQDFILPVLTNALFEQYTDFVDNQSKSPRLLTAFEQEKFEWDHAVVAAHVTHQWKFPDELVCCLFQHHQGLSLMTDPKFTKTTAAAVAISALIPDPFLQVPQGLAQLCMLEAAWEPLNLDEIADRVQEEFISLGGISDIIFRLSRDSKNIVRRL